MAQRMFSHGGQVLLSIELRNPLVFRRERSRGSLANRNSDDEDGEFWHPKDDAGVAEAYSEQDTCKSLAQYIV